MLEAGVGYGTIDLNVKMLKPVPLDQELIAKDASFTCRRPRRIGGVAQGWEGPFLAHATCTCAILRKAAV